MSAVERSNHDLCASIIAISSDAIVSIDEEQRITLFNRGAEAVFGYAAADVLGQPLDILIPEEVRAQHRQQVSEFGRSGISARRMSAHNKVIGRRANGERFPADASISQVEVDGKKIYTATLRDISEEVRAASLRQFLNDASHTLAESVAYDEVLAKIVGFVVPRLADYAILDLFDEEGRVTRPIALHRDPTRQELMEQLRCFPAGGHSAGAARVLRTGVAEVIPEVSATWLRAIARSEEHHRLLQQLAPRSAIILPLRARAHLVGVITCAFVTGERRYDPELLHTAERLAARAALAIDNAELYRDLQRTIRTRDEVLRIVAHDLRNPLNTIALSAGVLAETTPAALAHLYGPHLEVIRRSTEHANRLIGDLLDAARIREGKFSVELRPVTTAPLLEEAVTLQRSLVEEGGVRLEYQPAPDLPAIVADRDRILQVFANLIGNALKFTPDGGVITVRAWPEPGEVHFSITDTGPGIPARALPHLFEAFWQGQDGVGEGAGLGLAICKGIIAAHGGRIWVESQLGVGTTVYFTVPVAEPEPA